MLSVQALVKAIYDLINGDGGSAGAKTRDNGPAWASLFGLSGQRFTSADQSASATAVTGAPPASEFLVVTDILVSVDTAMDVDFSEETSGDIILSLYLPEDGTFQYTPRGKTKLKTANKRLMVRTSTAGNVSVTTHYYYEA